MLSKAEFRGAMLALCGVMTVVYLLVWLTPGIPGVVLLQSLRLHFVALGLGLLVLTLWSGARIRGLLFLGVILASAAQAAVLMGDYYARRSEPVGDAVAQFRFLSFNVLAENARAGDLVEAVMAEKPDVFLVMEARGISDYFDRLSEVFPYRIGCEGDDPCDIALFSRHAVSAPQLFDLPPFFRRRLVIAQVDIEGTPVTIAGLHLSKPYFDEAAWGELYFIRQKLEGIAGPMVVSGDFNAAPWSEPVAILADELDLAPGPWPAATWPVRLGPLGVPIDNMFTRGNARLLTLEAGDNLGSNHRPLRADVEIYAD